MGKLLQRRKTLWEEYFAGRQTSRKMILQEKNLKRGQPAKPAGTQSGLVCLAS